MKTSYFANLKNLKNPLSISRYPPKWYNGPELKMLAPSKKLLKDAHDGLSNLDYRKRYYEEVLNHLDAKDVYDAIIEEFGEDVCLLCFEKPGDFCHRRLVAEWFETNLDILVCEWEPKSKNHVTLKF